MQPQWRALVEQIVHARPTNDDDAKHVLEWVARRDGKSLPQLVEELGTVVNAPDI
jgi:hypothetical protein